jgi:uncharacterized cysteine cluster protein YcgN (CxxCxxCC family)
MSKTPPTDSSQAPFWERKTLEELSEAEWEALCDGCGRCCMVKLEDIDTGERLDTRLACRVLDIGACRCSDYANRHAQVPDCVRLTPESVRTLDWLPDSCAYRLRSEGKPLYWWHPLVSGDPETVHRSGVSVRDMAISETRAGARCYEDFAIRRRRPMRRLRRRR